MTHTERAYDGITVDKLTKYSRQLFSMHWKLFRDGKIVVSKIVCIFRSRAGIILNEWSQYSKTSYIFHLVYTPLSNGFTLFGGAAASAAFNANAYLQCEHFKQSELLR